MDNFLLIFILFALGMVLARVKDFPENTSRVLNLYVIWVALPGLVLAKIPDLVFSNALLTPIIMPWLMCGFSVVLVLLLSRLFGWSRSVTGGLLMVVPLGNTSFVGIPMVEAFFGDQGVPFALLYDQLGSFLTLSTYGAVIVAFYGGTEAPTVRMIIKRVVTFPPFWALVIALVMRSWSWPGPMMTFYSRVGDTLAPVVMVAVGFQFRLSLPADQRQPLIVGLLLKLVVTPLVALAGVTALGVSGLPVAVSVFEAGMPSMITAGAVATAAGLAPPLMAGMVGFGILFSVVTLSILFSMLPL
ncbi:MAG: AEC family transporter [Magnetococcales bacterium]|nr:AEC family transporter [Magnetococcales bacterium]